MKKIRKPVYSIDDDGNREDFIGVRAAGRAMTGNPDSSGSQIRASIRTGRKAYGRNWFEND
jgi:hypothetical protein